MKTLVIGYGNTLRGDDGVGQVVAKQVADWDTPEVRSIAVQQLTPELAELIAQAEVVCFVDALFQPDDRADRRCQLERLDSQAHFPQIDHLWNPSGLLDLAVTLYQGEPIAYLLLVPVSQFDYGDQLSPVAIGGIREAIQIIELLVDQEILKHA